MRRVPKLYLICGLALGWVGPAAAQGSLNTGLLYNKSVQKELKLSDDQFAKTLKVPQQVYDKYTKEMSEVRKEGQAVFAKQEALRNGLDEDTLKAMTGVLKPEQVKRLKQIEIQARGFRAFHDPKVQKALQLSKDQVAEVKTLDNDLIKTVNQFRVDASKDKKFDELPVKIDAATQEAVKKFVGKLTAEQKKPWKEMTGAPFKEAGVLGWYWQGSPSRSQVMLLHNDKVKKELKLSDAQKEKAQKAALEIAAKFKEKTTKMQKEMDAYFEKSRKFNTKTYEEINQGILDLLKPEQVKRLRQISVQQQGVAALTSADVQKKLQLTADQKKDMRAINDTLQTEISKAYLDVRGDAQKFGAVQKKVATLNKEALEKMVAKLTTEQKKTWKDLVGAPFELKMDFQPPPPPPPADSKKSGGGK
jgi:hypothetical protein